MVMDSQVRFCSPQNISAAVKTLFTPFFLSLNLFVVAKLKA